MSGNPRKPKFSDAELEQLVHGVIEQYRRLFGSLQSRTTTGQKTAIWAKIVDRVNCVSYCKRDIDDCKKRWYDLRGRVRKLVADHKKHMRGTGGGSPKQLTLHPLEQKVWDTIDRGGVEGIGGHDTTATDDEGDDHGEEDGTQTPAKSLKTRAGRCRDVQDGAEASTSGMSGKGKELHWKPSEKRKKAHRHVLASDTEDSASPRDPNLDNVAHDETIPGEEAHTPEGSDTEPQPEGIIVSCSPSPSPPRTPAAVIPTESAFVHHMSNMEDAQNHAVLVQKAQNDLLDKLRADMRHAHEEQMRQAHQQHQELLHAIHGLTQASTDIATSVKQLGEGQGQHTKRMADAMEKQEFSLDAIATAIVAHMAPGQSTGPSTASSSRSSSTVPASTTSTSTQECPQDTPKPTRGRRGGRGGKGKQ